ncbi:LysR family transcriptional regulator [Xanthobacter tagetidis]|uniref:LysR family transcriptional regulator n=1 Tax=Xanthobacter tagetidis TaxID=60216 RepID=A0A3L7AG73_9HYPH|nr:LysR family transcriptional regulator [Xanthobacter tagetidis]MBB6308457.1 DNA-binding transcriptional LysR family regulator [Xanthobacter tagetidis]RLP78760.1 LysR family transcriptional regulator [Xanthobacter tagetidis]
MDVRQMQYFLCLAETRHMTRAARRLNIVQPALSMQIARLEAEFGQKLFDRSAHGVTPTRAGETLARLVAPIVRDVEHAIQEMARLDGRIGGRVAVGLVTSVAQSTLASSTATIVARYPDVELSACEGYTETLLDWVASGQLDLAFVNVPRRRLSLDAVHVLDEDMVFACRNDPADAPPGDLTIAQLERFDLVLPSRRHGLRAILDERAAEAGIKLKPRLEIDTLPAICDVIASTDLVTVLPTIALHQALALGKVQARRFRGPRLSRSIVVAHHPRRAISAAAMAVVEVLRQDMVAAAASASRFIVDPLQADGDPSMPAGAPRAAPRRAPRRPKPAS